MIDVDGIRDLLKRSDIYVKENSKNFVCKCIYCGDHHKKEKQGHLYVSKDDNIPVCHCWYCNGSWSIKKFLKDLTGDERNDLIVPINNKNYVKRDISSIKKYNVPELNVVDYPLKKLYMERRTFGKIDIKTIPNLIFDINGFFEINNLDINKYFVSEWERDYIHNSMVGFLSKRNTILYCRNVQDKDVPLKFKKVTLQKTEIGLDYYCIDNGIQDSTTLVLSEGNFDILGCYVLDTLNLRDKCRAYCSGCTFSYEELLKSTCYDFGIYRSDVVVLSDSDKMKFHYKKFIQNCSDLTNSINIYYNCYGKDFGNFPQKAVKVF